MTLGQEISQPLVLIAHSLEGIVVKQVRQSQRTHSMTQGLIVLQALLQARLEPRYHSIRDAILGLFFLGTPHRGSDTVSYRKVLANVAQFMAYRPLFHLFSVFQANSDVLVRLTEDFRFQLSDYQICSFYEQRPIKGLSSLIKIITYLSRFLMIDQIQVVVKLLALLNTNHEE